MTTQNSTPPSTLPQVVPSASPLAGVNSQTLDYVFSKAPKDITDAELDFIAETLRDKRKLWHQQELTGAKKATGAAKAALSAAPKDLTLGDLE